jgi:hypothetical protein
VDAGARERRQARQREPRLSREKLGFAGLARAEGEPDRAARLLGAAAALRQEHGLALGPVERSLHERTSRAVQLAGAAGAAADGRTMAPEEAVAYALRQSSSLPAGSLPPRTRLQRARRN